MKKHEKRNVFFAILAVMAFALLSACHQADSSPEVNSNEVSNEHNQQETRDFTNVVPNESSKDDDFPVISQEQARDAIIIYLLERYDIEVPGSWEAVDQTPANLVGSSKTFFTSGAWSVIVQSSVVAPEYLVFSIEAGHIPSGLRWLGEVKSSGEISEISVIEPLVVLSAKDAGSAAATFIIANHGWAEVGQWVEQSREPTDNAGLRVTYTSGEWVVQVEYLAGAPLTPEYQVTADNLSKAARWVGNVKADGTVSESTYLQD